MSEREFYIRVNPVDNGWIINWNDNDDENEEWVYHTEVFEEGGFDDERTYERLRKILSHCWSKMKEK